MQIKFKIKLTDSQKEAYALAHNKELKYLTLVWSRQSGKSTLMKVLVIEWLFNNNTKIGYVCRNYILAKRIYKDLVQYIPKEYVKSANASDLIIETIYGSSISLFSAESGDSLRGLTFNYLICDEFAFFNDCDTLWNEVLFPTVKVHGRKTIFVSTPCGKQNLFHDMYLRGLKDEYPIYASLKKTIFDDGLITEEEIENIKSQIPILSFKQEFLVEFLDSAVTYFSGFENCFSDYEYRFNEKQWCGVDLSTVGTDDTVVTLINESKQTLQYIIKGTLDQKYQQIADILNNTKNIQKVYIECNGVGAPMINEIKKLVTDKQLIEDWVTTNDSKVRILSQLAIDISKQDIYFNNNNKILYTQLSTFIYKYTKTGKVQLMASGSNHDDTVLSLAIALECKNKSILSGDYNFRFGRKYK